MRGVDYSFGRPRPSTVAKAGYGFVCRYLSPPPNKKNLLPVEAAGLRAAGLDIVVVWESTANRALSGAAGGAVDGAKAKAMTEACHASPDSPIYYAVDFDAQPGQYPAIAEFLTAAGRAAAPHPVGVYGSYGVCVEMKHRGVATYAWQTVAWSHGQRLAMANLYQDLGTVYLDGVPCDVDEALQADYGGWRPIAVDRPAPCTPTQGRTMDARDQLTHDATGRAEKLVTRLCSHFNVVETSQPNTACTGDGLQQLQEAAARNEANLAALAAHLNA